MSVNHFAKRDDLHYNIIAQICRAENFDRSDITLRKASSSMVPLLGSLRKHDVDGSEKVI